MGHWEDDKPLLQREHGEKMHLLSHAPAETVFTPVEKRNIALFIAGMLSFFLAFCE
jgi:hypothetical protein